MTRAGNLCGERDIACLNRVHRERVPEFGRYTNHGCKGQGAAAAECPVQTQATETRVFGHA